MNTRQWHQLLSDSWTQIFQSLRLPHDGVFVEVGPGKTDKIGLALSNYEFRGELYIIDPCRGALLWVKERYAQILPGVNVIPVMSSFEEAGKKINSPVDVILMNHVFDDMILYKSLPRIEREIIFNGIIPGASCHPSVAEIWKKLEGLPHKAENLAHTVAEECIRTIEHFSPDFFIANQYPSGFIKSHGLEIADILGKKTAMHIASTFENNLVEHLTFSQGHMDLKDWFIFSLTENTSYGPSEILTSLAQQTK